MRYPLYLATTHEWERHLYRLFLALEHAKEWYAHLKAQERQEAEPPPTGRGGR